jgi:hypothetical protein
MASTRASLDLSAGHVQIAGRRHAVRATGEGGRVQVGDDGPILRPPTFGERTRLVAAALGAEQPAVALATALVTTLREQGGACDAPVERVVALLLAGAGDDGPAFVDSAALVARATATALPSVESLEAAQVDYYARALADEVEQDDGWHRVLLAPPAIAGVAHDDSSSDEMIVIELAEALLSRGRSRGSPALRQAAVASDTTDAPPVADAGAGAWAREHSTGASAVAAPATREPLASTTGAHPTGAADARPDTQFRTPSHRPLGATSTTLQPLAEDAGRDAAGGAAPREAARPEASARVATPLLRFRQPSTAPTSPASGQRASEGPAIFASSSPAVLAREPVRVPPPAAGAASPERWVPFPWRLAPRGGTRGLGRDDTALVASGDIAIAAAVPSRTAAIALRPAHATPSAPLSADDLAERVAESLRREAARRGLVS